METSKSVDIESLKVVRISLISLSSRGFLVFSNPFPVFSSFFDTLINSAWSFSILALGRSRRRREKGREGKGMEGKGREGSGYFGYPYDCLRQSLDNTLTTQKSSGHTLVHLRWKNGEQGERRTGRTTDMETAELETERLRKDREGNGVQEFWMQ